MQANQFGDKALSLQENIQLQFKELIKNDPSWMGRQLPAKFLVDAFLEGNEQAGLALVQATMYGGEVEYALYEACKHSGKLNDLTRRVADLKDKKGIFTEDSKITPLEFDEFQRIIIGKLSFDGLAVKKIEDDKKIALEKLRSINVT